MRTGPRPLSMQIGMATSYWPFSAASTHFPAADLPEELGKMLLGINLYQNHSFQPARAPLNKAWNAGEVSISSIQGHDYKAGGPPVLLIPSLINKAYILDLVPERSMLRFLAAQGLNPYLLDWGQSINDPGQQDVESLITKRLVPALQFLSAHEKRPVHALGYCMGGTLLMGATPLAKDSLASVIMLAAPWDFHAGSQALLDRVKFWTPSALPLIDEKGLLPVDWIQVVFASLDPFMAARKFAAFADMQQDSEAAHLFVAVEDWLNDGIDLPAKIAHHCIRDWFFENRPGQGSWIVAGEPVVPEEIATPALIITSEKDRLVEYDTAAGLAGQMENATLLKPVSGHIGMIAGGKAVDQVWGPLAAWIKSQQ